MQADALTVEVRNRDLVKVGSIEPEALDLAAQVLYNDVGQWTLNLAPNHPMASELVQPGSGIVVTGPNGVIFSGPMVTAGFGVNPNAPAGALTIVGATDDIILSDALCYPQPDNPDAATQSRSFDLRGGRVETVIHGFVSANLGPSAPAARKTLGVVMGQDSGRGPQISTKARFVPVGPTIADIAKPYGIGFRVIQRANGKRTFETYIGENRSAYIRLSVWSDTLSSESAEVSAPGVTEVVVGGDGTDQARAFLSAHNEASLQAQAAWGRRIERFKDARDGTNATEYQQAADQELATDGFTGVNVQVVPVEDYDGNMQLGRDWNLGDTISVTTDFGEYPSLVTGIALVAGPDKVLMGALLGDGIDDHANEAKTIRKLVARITSLETSQ